MARKQIDNLRRRLVLIRGMQLLGAISLLLCVVAMVAVMLDVSDTALFTFGAALLLMGASLTCLVWEVWISGGALKIMLSAVEGGGEKRK
jgi:hypothetical protein